LKVSPLFLEGVSIRNAARWLWAGAEAFDEADASAVAAVESVASANTEELVALKTSAAAAQAAAGACENLDIRVTPQS